jgi:hypothetical protein
LNITEGVDTTSANTIKFNGAGGRLIIGPNAFSSTATFLPTINGFGASDAIQYQGVATGVSYSSGKLTLFNGATTVAVLTLTGNYAGDTFFVNAINSSTTQISVSTGGDAASAPAGTAAADQYVWSPNVAGSWDVAGNWIDTTANQTPALAAPGANDLVSIDAANGFLDVVTGSGAAASLTLAGEVDLRGTYTVATASDSINSSAFGNSSTTIDGTFTDSGDFDSAYYGLLTVNGSVKIGGNLVDYYGHTVTVAGGGFEVAAIKPNANYATGNLSANYNVTGGFFLDDGALAGNGDSITVSGGSFTIKGLTALGNQTFNASGAGVITLKSISNSGGQSDYFTVTGATATIEIGTAGSPLAGGFTLDSGNTLLGGGSINAPEIIVNGVLDVVANATEYLYGGTYGYNPGLGRYLYTGGVSGSGTLQIDANAELYIADGVDPASNNIIKFNGSGASLYVGSYAVTPSGVFAPTISGFTVGDSIQFGSTVNGLSFSGNVLTLWNSAVQVASFTLTGSFAGDTFHLSNNTVTLTSGGTAATPVIVNPASVASGLNDPLPVPNVEVLEATVLPSLTVTLTATNGLLIANSSALGGGGAITGSGTKNLQIVGTAAQIDADLTTLQYDAITGSNDTIAIAASNGVGGVANASISVAYDAKYPVLAVTSIGNLTSTQTLAFSGTINTASAGLWVYVYANSTYIGGATATAGGNWSLASGTLPNLGVNVITAKATDSASNTGVSAPVTVIVGGGYSASLGGANGSIAYLFASNSNWDALTGSNDTIRLIKAQASITGASNTIYLDGSSSDVIGLYATSGVWDAVYGSNGTIALNNAQTSVSGGGDTIYFQGASGNVVGIYATSGVWDAVYGSSGTIALNNAQSNVIGSGDTIFLDGSSNDVVGIYATGGVWDSVYGSNGTIALNNAQSNVIGGGDTIFFQGASGNVVGIYATSGVWDSVYGSNGTIALNNAQSNVIGSGDTIYFQGASGNVVGIYATGGIWDSVYGSNGAIALNNAQSNVIGGGDTIYFQGASGNVVGLYATSGVWDSVQGSNGTIALNNAQATATGNNETVYFSGTNVFTANGASDLFVFQPTIGLDTINAFGSTDKIQFSKSDFANWSALLSHISQSGANTLITLDASDQVTLTGMTASNLSSAQFNFV